MSLGARATKGGAKGGGKDAKHVQEKGKGTEKVQPKEKAKPQATTEQLRMAIMIDRKSDDSTDVRQMVMDLMEMTCRTEEEVCSALHDADNVMEVACDILLEETQRIQGEWRTSEKKKKKPPAPVGNGEVEPPRESRSRSGPRPRRGEGEGAGRGRGTRGRGGARGGRAGRPARRARPTAPHNQGHGGNMGDSFPTTEDWDNEEWSGSLSDTKVFTASSTNQNPAGENDAVNNVQEDWDAPTETNNGHSSPHIPSYTYHNTNHQQPTPAAVAVAGGGVTTPTKPEPEPIPYHAPQHLAHQPMGMSGSLTAAQSQYLSQLTQQSQRHDNSVYTTNYGVYGSNEMASQRKPQRARVPPPSKIPSSAVEMPGGGEGGSFLDVQFGALEPEAPDTPPPHPAHPAHPAHATNTQTKQAPPQPEPQPAPSLEPSPEANNSYTNASSMLSDGLSSADAAPSAQPPPPDITATTASLEKQLSSSMKQLSVSAASPAPAPAPAQQTYQHRPKTVGPQQNVYATHHAVSHHPPVYGANVYAPQQVNSTNAPSLAQQPVPAALSAGYGSNVTLSQYQPMLNSYQTSTTAGVYGGAALYTAAPYAAYQPPHKMPAKEQQYDSSVQSSNNLPSTTTQTSTAKVTTTTVSSTSSSASASASAAASTGGSSSTAGGAGAYAVAPALYGAAGVGVGVGGAAGASYAYDESCLRGTLPHHMGPYYEVGYGARDTAFSLTQERFARADAASPQQVQAALPPGYAYFYQPPPTTYQYGVYPYGSTSSVGGVGGVGVGGVSGAGKVSSYAAQQPPYDQQDSYKPGGPYNAPTNKSASAAGSGADISNAMYAKAHVALNKVNSYEKASFHSGTPPPFGAAHASHHLYIPAPPHHHHHPLPPSAHQMDVRVNSSQNRRESAGSGAGAGAAARAAKPGAAKPPYSQSYWPPN